MEGYNSAQDSSLQASTIVSTFEVGDLPHGYTYEERGPPFEKPELVDSIDTLIEELESHNGQMEKEQDADDESGSCHHVPLEDLRTNTRTGLTDTEVNIRKKKYGLNQMRKEEKQHPIVKFLMYFVGPIQFVMEVSCERCPCKMFVANCDVLGCCGSGGWSSRLGRPRSYLWVAPSKCHCRIRTRVSSRLNRRRIEENPGFKGNSIQKRSIVGGLGFGGCSW